MLICGCYQKELNVIRIDEIVCNVDRTVLMSLLS